nr:JAZ10 [Fagopyrum tataricum]
MVELDFMGVKNNNHPSPPPQNLDRRRSFRGIQSAISKMNPNVIKSVIANGSPSGLASKTQTAPMTIFYNGKVTVLDATKDQAGNIFKMAMAVASKNLTSSSPMSYQPDEVGLPHARRKSLERFFEKRKERLMSVFPYEIPKPKRHVANGAGDNR